MRSRQALIVRSAIAGVVWGGIGITILRGLTGGEYFGGRRSVWELRGALIAAPLIGVALGFWSPLFRRSGLAGRAAIAAFTLYVSAGAFLVAASTTMNGFDEFQRRSLAANVAESFNEAFLALTVTGLVLILAPLAYVTHLLVSRGHPDASAETGEGLGLRE